MKHTLNFIFASIIRSVFIFFNIVFFSVYSYAFDSPAISEEIANNEETYIKKEFLSGSDNVKKYYNVKSTQPVDITLQVLINEFKSNTDTEIRFFSLISAADYGENAEPFFEYVTSSSSDFFRAAALKLLLKKNLKFDTAILNCLDAKEENLGGALINCWQLITNQSDRNKISDFAFKNNNIKYISLALPPIFSSPRFYMNYVRQTLSHENAELRFQAYKYLVTSAPDFFEFACLGLFDEDISINRFILSQHNLYKENGKRLIIYGLNSSKPLVKEYAGYILKDCYR